MYDDIVSCGRMDIQIRADSFASTNFDAFDLALDFEDNEVRFV